MSPTYVPVDRTFSEFLSTEGQGEDFEHWSRFALRTGRIGWAKLLEKRGAVILGEARSGKTEEFRRQAERLRAVGQAAFFIRLDELVHGDIFVALGEQATAFQTWLEGDREGYFFLDSVDEARLLNAAALRGAISKVRGVLVGGTQLRAHILVSSRISDWMTPAVRDAVALLIRGEGGQTGDPSTYQIDPLERAAVIAIARTAHGINDAEALWAAVEEGGYEPYARRPGDLEWLSARWNQSGSLGGLTDLTEAAVRVRLEETNDSYITAGAVIAPEKLGAAVQALAAACVLSGRPQILAEGGSMDNSLVSPADVLSDMTPLERRRVLGSAVFDAASLGRVRFHHRTVREYLAARWIQGEIELGMPVDKAIDFFVAVPFGERVLIRPRRGVLCWLTAFNPDVREFVVRHFPEMVMFEGDPTRWAQSEVVESFEGYLRKLKAGFSQDWWNDATEYARVARALPAETLIQAIATYADDPSTLNRVFKVIEYGRRAECANAIYALYVNAALPTHVRTRALWALEDIASPEHRDQVRGDLVAGSLWNNDARAAGVVCAGFENLSREEVAALLRAASPSDPNRSDSLAEEFSRNLPRRLDYAGAMRLLLALQDAIPVRRRREMGSRFGEDRKPFAWLLEAFTEVFKRVIHTYPCGLAPVPIDLVDAAVLLERMHRTSFVDGDDIRELRPAIAEHSGVRRAIALAIGIDGPTSFSNLTGYAGLVCLGTDDLPWVVEAASNNELSLQERQVWFRAAVELLSATHRGARRRQALQALVAGPDATERATALAEDRQRRTNNVRAKIEGRAEKAQERDRKRSQRERLTAELRSLRGEIVAGTHLGALTHLVSCARDHNCDFETIDPAAIAGEYDPDVIEAFRQGLQKAYKVLEPPDFIQYIGQNSVPWAGLVGMASANFALREGLDSAGAGVSEAVAAMRFAAWSHQEPHPWVAEATQRFSEEIAQALMPTIEAELCFEGRDDLRTFDLALRSAPPLRAHAVRRALALMDQGRIPNSEREFSLARRLRDHPEAREALAYLARSRLVAATQAAPPTLPATWLQAWMGHDLPAAWGWVQSLVPTPYADSAILAANFAASAGNFETWAKDLQATAPNVGALKEAFTLVESSFPLANPDSLSERPIDHFLNRVPGVLASLRFAGAHAALRELADRASAPHAANWLRSLADTMAAEIAERKSVVEPRELRTAHDVFTRDAATEAELLEQVVVAIDGIRRRIELGPHSVRGFFTPRMPESDVQVYLADELNIAAPVSRFRARYRASREPQVDARNKPDLEVVAASGRVPVEVKPVDTSRYSATDLASTLRDQLVSKYLVGGGSRHGVLVVFKLEEKRWAIPGGPNRGTFADLVAYLQAQAKEIVEGDPRVGGLAVIGVDCTPRA